MDISIIPAALTGTVEAIESKSDAHRLLICAALSEKPTKISIKNISKDIIATMNCLAAMGGGIQPEEGNAVTINPLWQNLTNAPLLDCGESGSTLRFLMPVAAALYDGVNITGSGRLPERPLSAIMEAMQGNGCHFSDEKLPFRVTGQLKSGKYELPGNVSSQFVSGLLFALPLLEGTSEIVLTSPLESSAYVKMTVSTLAKFGILIVCKKDRFVVPGGQKYSSSASVRVDGDWSNAAFWLAAGAINGQITCTGLDVDSLQSDRRMLNILGQMGADAAFENGTAFVGRRDLHAISIDVTEIPDLVPVLAGVMALANGISVIKNAGRVRLKESDRLHAIAQGLNAIGADVQELADSLVIRGKERLDGGVVHGCNDHRIVMALAIVAGACEEPVVIQGAEAIEKSYPDFFRDYNKLGGLASVI